MAQEVRAAPTFKAVLSGEPRPHSRSVALLFGAEDGQKYAVDFSANIVPATVTALLGFLGQVTSNLPEDDGPTPQVLQTTGMSLAMNEQGEVGLSLQFEGGAEIILALPSADLPALQEQIAEAVQLAERRPAH